MTISKVVFGMIAVLLALGLIAPAVFGGGYNLAGVGPRALAMSGAFHGVADDWSAVYWNPAGLSGQSKSIALGFKALYPIVSAIPNVASSYPGYSGYANGVEMTTAEKAFPAGDLGLVHPINGGLTAGFGIYAPSALGAEWSNLFTGPPYGYNNTVDYTPDSWNTDIKVIDLHPTLAYKFNEMLSIGMGISVQYGAIILETPKKVPTGAPMPFEHFYVDAILDGSGMGYGFNAGLLCKLNQYMNLGLSYRNDIDIAVEGTVKQTLYCPDSPGIVAADSSKAPLFSGGTKVAEPDANADFPIPGDFGVGVALKPIPALTVALDALWTHWSYVNEVTIKMDGVGPTGAPAEDIKMIMRYEDTWKLSVGADYLLCPKRQVHLLAGYYFDPTPIPDESLRPSIADVADKNNLSFGLSMALTPNLTVDGYWEHIWTDVRTVPQLTQEPGAAIDNVAGDWKLRMDTFGLSFGYRF